MVAMIPGLARCKQTSMVVMVTILLSIAVCQGANTSLSSYLWESSTDLLANVYNTNCIKGVVYGDMDPNFYGAYTLQDASWCREISFVWAQVAQNQSAHSELREFASHSSTGYLKCSTYLFEAFAIKDNGNHDYGVILGQAATSYVNVVINAINTCGSPYVVIATYACVKLWSNITANLSTMVNSSNPYSSWVYNNTGNSSAIKQGDFIDKWASWYDKNLSLSIFRKAMGGEIGLFNLWPTNN
ncbi:hypothetical protein L7F22_009521 [Adiantum nelumboides]|nr:hypothetical protein [Adiantum nelumboides]